MRGPGPGDGKTASVLADLARTYEVQRVRVDAAHERIRTLVAGPHGVAQGRDAARDLDIALRDASTTASLAARTAIRATEQEPRHHGPGHRKASRQVPPDVRSWSAELVRLGEVAVWLRRTALDDTGSHLPRTVRVANYAAKGPHIAGLDFGNQAAPDPRGPRIGIDLEAVLEGVTHRARSA